MAIFRGTGGSGSSSDSTIVDAVTAQATIATTKADEAEGFRDEAEGFKNTASSAATTATNKATEANASATTAEGNKDLCVSLRGETQGLAQDALASANAAEASATTANSSAVQTVAGSNTQVVGVYNNIANVNTVAGVNTDVTTVAGISSDVTTVAADASDIGTVSTNIANVNNVGNNIANVNAVHGNASNINTVAADGTDIGTVATNIANVNTVAGISSNVTTVAGLESKMDTVIADASDIGAVAGNIGDVTTVAGINADVDTVAGIAAKVTTVADNISDVQAADTNATNAATSASNASASATSASNSATTATTKATEASNSATAASNSATTATTKASQAAGSATTAGTSASTATTKASEASSSATTATTKAGEAASSASAASGSASTATTKASEASASAASAATSATNSSNAASTWNNFYNSYLGVADAQPSVDVLGNAIVAGALYYDTGAGSNTVGLYVYNGSSWVYSTNYNNVTAPYILAQDLNANGNDIISAGKVGIGTTSPHALLHVDGGDVKISSDSATSNGDGKPTIFFSESGADEVFAQISYHGDDQSGINNFIGIGCNGSSGTSRALMKENHQMVVTAGGNVGIGTSSPARALHVSSGTTNEVARFESTDTACLVEFKDTTGTASIETRNDFRFSAGGSERLRIDSSGNVGIGTASPTQELHVVSSGESDIRLQGSNSANYLDIFHNASDFGLWGTGTQQLKLATNNAERLRIDSAGNVGIGTTSPDAMLHVRKNQTADTAIEVSNLGTAGASTSSSFIVSEAEGVPKGWFRRYRDGTSRTALGFTEHLVFEGGIGSSPTERMRINASGNVGIGTDSPSQKLHVDSGEVLIKSAYSTSGTTNSKIYFASRDNGDWRNTSIGNISDALTFATGGTGTTHTNGTERMRITSSGNVGIGTTSPAANLHVSSSGDTIARITSADGNSAFLDLGDASDPDGGRIVYDSGSNLALYTASTERMRIDSSGNLLVGTTDSDTGNAGSSSGIALGSVGYLTVARNNATPIYANRLSGDGEVISIRKDGTTVGSIGTASGDLNINGGANHSGIRFQATGLYPLENGTVSSGEIDLGAEGSKFKNLYLSGGVHLGGTASANKLDDYEEGTFTLNTAGDSTGVFQDTPSCRYTKIGNTVHVLIAFRIGTNFTGQNVGGLPFTANHSGMNSSFISTGVVLTSTNNTVSAAVGDLSTTVRFHDNQNTSDPHLPNTTAQYYRLNFTYQTNS